MKKIKFNRFPGNPGVYTFGPEHEGLPRFFIIKRLGIRNGDPEWKLFDRADLGKNPSTQYVGGRTQVLITGNRTYWISHNELREYFGDEKNRFALGLEDRQKPGMAMRWDSSGKAHYAAAERSRALGVPLVVVHDAGSGTWILALAVGKK